MWLYIVGTASYNVYTLKQDKAQVNNYFGSG